MPAGAASLADLRLITGLAPSAPVLPLPAQLARVWPAGGLTTGHTISVLGSRTLLLMMASELSAQGGWCAAVGFADLGALAASELGIELERFAVIPQPGAHWAAVTSALMDGADLILVSPPQRPHPADLRRLSARARERKVTLLSDQQWEGADLRASATTTWEGLGQGWGHLAARSIAVSIEGRRLPRPRTVILHP